MYPVGPSPEARTTNRSSGTFVFMPPELLITHIDPETGRRRKEKLTEFQFNPYLHDSYSFGITLMEAIMGRAEANSRSFAPEKIFSDFWEEDNYSVDNDHLKFPSYIAVKLLIAHSPEKRALITKEFLAHFL